MSTPEPILTDEQRHRDFPVTRNRIFLAHAGVAPLPRVAADALRSFADHAESDDQESEWALRQVGETRRAAARMLGCEPSEIALLGPTSLGLNLVAQGLPWQAGDEVVYYPDDYPANVYPWRHLAAKGVVPVALRPAEQGVITWPVLEPLLTARTRLVALATCNFVSGFRIDHDDLGRRLHERGILFCLDGIQTVGGVPTPVRHVDFLSADSHKWMLGPVGAGIVYVKASRQELLQPMVLGSWNVVSPNFVAQDAMQLHPGSRRYEPGTFNLPGIVAMGASLRMLLDAGVARVAQRIAALRAMLVDALHPLGYRALVTTSDSGIVSFTHERVDLRTSHERLNVHGVTASLRYLRSGSPALRFSPHFYNTEAEIQRVVEILDETGTP